MALASIRPQAPANRTGLQARHAIRAQRRRDLGTRGCTALSIGTAMRLVIDIGSDGSGLDARRPAGRDKSAGMARGDGNETAHRSRRANSGPVFTPCLHLLMTR